jgi:hypothetical protein
VITIDFVATADTDDPVLVHLYLREPGEQRPGHRLITATKPGGSANGAGHGTIALPLHTGDELSTYAETPDSDSRQVLQTVTFTGYKIAHLSDYTKEFDMEAWSADLKVLD